MERFFGGLLLITLLFGAYFFITGGPKKDPSGLRATSTGSTASEKGLTIGSTAGSPGENYLSVRKESDSFYEQLSRGELPKGFETKDLSPFYGKVLVDSASPSRTPFAGGDFTVRASFYSYSGDTNPIDITGWYVKNNRGNVAIIPRAVQNYSLSYLPETDIVLNGNDYISFKSAVNPIRQNLRLNKCTGYLKDFYNSDLELPNNCEIPDRSEIASFSGSCQSYIMSLSVCEAPSGNAISSFSGSYDVACRAYLDTLNYTGCYNAHRKDPDFFSNEWRVWIDGGTLPLDPEHDRLLLFDRSGLLVDEYYY